MKKSLFTAATAGVALLVAPAADAKIVVQQSIAGVKMGMTRAQVEKVLGTDAKVRTETSEITGPYKVLRYGLTEVSISGGSQGSVFSVTTRSKKQRTSKNVGVGSSEKVLRQRVKGLKCVSYGKVRSCTRGSFTPGATVTEFRFGATSRRVARVSIGLVID